MSSETHPPAVDLAQGWTPVRQALFLDHLSHKGNVRAACARVGLSREAAYKLRRRDPLFARGWAAALALAREAVAEILADRAIDGIEEKIYYRGELVDTRRKYDNRLLLAHLARLDRLADDAAAEDAARFDELLACVAGAECPEELACEDQALPLDRATAGEMAAELAAEEVREAAPDAMDGDAGAGCASRRAYLEALARWDAWFHSACGRVDALAELAGPLPAATASGVPPEPDEAGPLIPACTLSDVSTGAPGAGNGAGSPGPCRGSG